MKKIYIIAVVVIIVLAAGAWWYMQNNQKSVENLGTYAYECDEHVAFEMTPASDMSSIAIKPSNGGAYPPAVTLVKKDSASGVRYEGGGVIFTAKGETVTLSEGDSAINCSPTPSQTEAPFNFGD